MRYAINKSYEFGAVGPGNSSTISVRIRFGHKKAMEYGEYFMGLWDKEMEIPSSSEIKDIIDESEARSFAHCLYENREDRSARLTDFYDKAWEMVAEEYYYYTWSEGLIRDCVDYYKAHSLKRLKSKKYDCLGVGYHGETGDDRWVKFKLTFEQMYRFGERYANAEDIGNESIDYGCKEEVAEIINSYLNPDVYDYEAYYPKELIASAKELYLLARKYM